MAQTFFRRTGRRFAGGKEMRSKWLVWLVLWCGATSICLHQFARPHTAPIDEDELYWIGSVYYFHLALNARQWIHAHWRLLPARENPPVAKYVLGLGLKLQGHTIDSTDLLGAFYLVYERTPGAWGDAEQRTKRVAVVESMTPEVRAALRHSGSLTLDPALLVAARRVALFCTVIASLLLFVLGGAVGGPLAGFIASQLLLLHPAVIDAYNHAMADALAMPWQIAAALAGLMLLRRLDSSRPNGRGVGVLAILLGALLALACGSKMNSLVVALWIAGAAVVMMATTWRRSPGAGRRIALCGCASLMSAVLVFVLVNPAIWPDISGGLLATFTEHRTNETIQGGFLGGHLLSITDKLGAVARLTCGSTWLLGFSTALAIGVLCVRRNRLWFVPGWYLFTLLCVVAWIPFARDRYVIPLIIPLALLVALAAAAAPAFAITSWQTRGDKRLARGESARPV